MPGSTANFNDHFIHTKDGIRIFARDFASSIEGTPIICLPGLTRNHRDFTQIANFLSQGPTPRRVICIDLRGRGNSDRDPDPTHYNLFTEMEDIVAVMDALQIERSDFIGTSRGGLVLHFMAGLHAERLRRVVLNDIGPVLEKQGLMQIKEYLARTDSPKSWEECPAYLQTVHGKSFTALPAEEWQAMAKALYRDDNGKPLADYDPVIGSQIANMDFSQPIPDLWTQYEALSLFPLLIVRGENSALLSDACCDTMLSRNPHATRITAQAQGHAPLLHIHPIAQAISTFLNAAEG
ncbi:alpha/beta hydrolase [Rhizobium sp.]|jgi:pimeloyl-ACP methyl ester carboxylesterase|uniref:alpha/beta fold hydrolase n=1 Tax=Rhizobium sp. TaxID=391 RepID=UPI000E891B35|nr:alpha/beta hydrolase [Rhizobium sp.]